MNGGWRYRLLSGLGVVALTAVSVALANSPTVQHAVSTLPVVGALPRDPPGATEGFIELVTTTAVVAGACFPLYKPRPRRILDTVALAQKRVLVAVFALATVGYFDYTYRLPRLALLTVAPFLFALLPAWFVWIRRRPSEEPERAVVVGDDPDEIARIAEMVDVPLLGYLCPTTALDRSPASSPVADGGRTLHGIELLGGLSRIEDVLVEYDVDTVVLAFEHTDRAEFFGALDACYEHGVDAKVHREHADQVLTAEGDVGALLDVEVEPWDVQDYLLKRGFDVAFSAVGLVVSSPVILAIAAAIKLDDGGPVLYRQERTAVFGETFDAYKFRSMAPDGGSVEPVEDEDNDRITRVGRVLRRTHLDEIPQLWSILLGDMSVVGPRAVWTEEESVLEMQAQSWRQRWFVKPGLTGLAQVNGAKSTDPEEKLRWDLQYVKTQSFWLDMKVVLRQVWGVGEDVVGALRD